MSVLVNSTIKSQIAHSMWLQWQTKIIRR